MEKTDVIPEIKRNPMKHQVSGFALFRRRLVRNRMTTVGGCLIIMVILVAIFAPLLAPHDPDAIYYDAVLASPGTQGHLLGTDTVGRDLLSRIVYGARVSVVVGSVAVGISLALGLTVGLIAGFFGGFIESMLMRVVDIFLAFPVILLAIAIMGVLGPSLLNVIIALGFVGWAQYARLVRGEVLSVKEREFVESGRAIGASSLRLILVYILPNVMAPVIVIATFGMATAILAEASLSFLGLGIQPPTSSWGSILADGRTLMRGAPHVTIFPGIAIALTILGLNFLGDGLRDAFDPRLR